MKKGDFAEREAAALEVSNEAVRRFLESELQRVADEEESVVHHDVHTYRRHQPGSAKYHSLCGPLIVRRSTYRSIGVRNGPTIVPLELRAGLIENATPALAYAVAQGYAKAPMRSVEGDMLAAHRAPPSRATLERMAKAIGSDAKKCLMEIERRVRAAETLPESATGITIGLDRTTIPMEEAIDEDGPRRHRKPRVTVRYRMAYVGTVAVTDAEGNVLRSWRYGVPAHEGGQQLARRVLNDVRRALTEKPDLHIGIVQDGAGDVWNLVMDALADAGIDRGRCHEVIDIFHLFERLAKALEVVESDEDKRLQQLARWKRKILRDDSTITRIALYFGLVIPNMRVTWRRRPCRWTEEQVRQVDKLLAGYIGYPEHFHYTKMVKRGLHVGSGVTEGACKSLITERAKRSGQRWHKRGISAVMTLRTLVKSERFDAFWSRFARRYAPLARAA